MARGPSRTVTREDVYDVMTARPGEPLTSKELAEELPVSSDTVYNRLRELETQERISTKKVGGRARIWWVPDTATYDTSKLNADGLKQRQIIDAMASRSDAGDAWTTAELSEVTPHSSDNLYHYLREMEEQGKVESKSVGARAKVWWLAQPTSVVAG